MDVDGRVRLVVSDRGAQPDCGGPGQPPSAVRTHPVVHLARRGPTANAAKTGTCSRRRRRRQRLRAAPGRRTAPKRRDRTTRTAAGSLLCGRRYRRHPLGHRVRGVRTGRVRGLFGRYRNHGPMAIVLTTRLTVLRTIRRDDYDEIRRYRQSKHLKQLAVANAFFFKTVIILYSPGNGCVRIE